MKILDTYHTGQTGLSNGAPGIVLITDAMPEWNQKQWRDVMAANGIEPDPKPFRPSFKLAFEIDNSTGQKWPANYGRFADERTAAFIAQTYGDGTTAEQEVYTNGPITCDQKMILFKLPDGRWLNAGLIAMYYEQNPQEQFPGVAEKLIREVLSK